MIEQLLTSGVNKGQVNFPESGPGSKRLKFGTPELGYFGEVSAAELFDGYEVLSWPEKDVGGTDNKLQGLSWFKFVRNGKFIFIAKAPIRYGMTWNDLYNAGMVYGTRGKGLYPVGTGVEQLNPQYKMEGSRKWWLKPRLVRGLNVDPFSSGAAAEQQGSEWNELMYNITDKSAGGTGAWAQAGFADLTYQLRNWCQESLSSNLASTILRGDGNGVTAGGVSAKNTTGGVYSWRPVLELMDITGVAVKVDQVSAQGSAEGLEQPAINNPVPLPGVERIKGVYGFYDLLKMPAISLPTSTPGIQRVSAVNPTTSTLAAFTAKASYVA